MINIYTSIKERILVKAKRTAVRCLCGLSTITNKLLFIARRAQKYFAGAKVLLYAWSSINKYLLRTCFYSTNLEQDETRYRYTLHLNFARQYPDFEASELRLSDQIRATVRNNLLLAPTRKLIKNEVVGEQKAGQVRNSSYRIFAYRHHRRNRADILNVQH